MAPRGTGTRKFRKPVKSWQMRVLAMVTRMRRGRLQSAVGGLGAEGWEFRGPAARAPRWDSPGLSSPSGAEQVRSGPDGVVNE